MLCSPQAEAAERILHRHGVGHDPVLLLVRRTHSDQDREKVYCPSGPEPPPPQAPCASCSSACLPSCTRSFSKKSTAGLCTCPSRLVASTEVTALADESADRIPCTRTSEGVHKLLVSELVLLAKSGDGCAHSALPLAPRSPPRDEAERAARGRDAPWVGDLPSADYYIQCSLWLR